MINKKTLFAAMALSFVQAIPIQSFAQDGLTPYTKGFFNPTYIGSAKIKDSGTDALRVHKDGSNTIQDGALKDGEYNPSYDIAYKKALAAQLVYHLTVVLH